MALLPATQSPNLSPRSRLIPHLKTTPPSSQFISLIAVSHGRRGKHSGSSPIHLPHLASLVPLLGLPEPSRSEPPTVTRLLLHAAAPVVFFFVGMGAASACATTRPPVMVDSTAAATEAIDAVKGSETKSIDDGATEWDEEMEREFEAWKTKKFSLTVPLKIVALRGSFPASWVKDFLQSQTKRVRLLPGFQSSPHSIYSQLNSASKSERIDPKSTMAADLVTIGDSWFSLAIKNGLIEPIEEAEEKSWFSDLNDFWKIYLRRNHKGELDSEGTIWGAPYRWGSVVIAYKKDKFRKNGFAPVEDWADLWRPELAGRISMVASPREVLGTILKYMGASYNTTNIDIQVGGGRSAVLENLLSFQKQVRLFDNVNYLKAFTAGDVWVAVGWSSDVLPTAKRMANVAVIAPKSGSSLWADIWAVPASTKFKTDQIGGRTRGPSPLIHQWMSFCLQPARAFPFQQEVLPGATPSALQHSPYMSNEVASGNPLDTNLVCGMPPLAILAKSEFLEPLSEKALLDYQWLSERMQKPGRGWFSFLLDGLSTLKGHFHV